MHRHVTTQGAESVGAEKHEQDADVPEHAAHQHVLDLQTGAGNRATVQTLRRTGVDSPATGGQVIRRAGDKLAFEASSGLEDGVETTALEAISAAIEKYREEKRAKKDFTEEVKEIRIGLNNVSKDIALNRLKVTWPEGHEVLRFLEGQVEEKTIAQHKEALARYHDSVEGLSGWRWPNLKTDIWLALNGVCGRTPFEVSDRQGNAATVTVGGKVIYTVHFDDTRFVPDAPKNGQRQTFTKKGHEKSVEGGPDPRKQFVDDANGVKTRRFVTRAFNVFHLANMFGVSVVPPAWKATEQTTPSMSLPEKQQVLGRNLQKVKYEPKMDGMARVGGQEPRDLTKTFSEHANTFDLTSAASVLPKSPNEFTAMYQEGHSRVKAPGQRTGFEFVTGRNSKRGPQDTMANNEASSMQVRNGSGRGQPFLSAASVQAMAGRKQKIIRANKGERFDTGAENQGIVKIDLSLLPQEVNIVDQHSEPSHQHKIAWDRYYSTDDIKALADRFALADRVVQSASTLPKSVDVEELVARIRPSEKDLAIFNSTDRKAIESGDVTKIVEKVGENPSEYDARPAPDKYTKRAAPKELDEYIYSARKNREVLFDKLPLAAVTEIYLSDDEGKWSGLNEEVKRGVWLKLGLVQQELTDYLRGERDYKKSEDQEGESYHNIQLMHEKAEMGKLTEGHTRT